MGGIYFHAANSTIGGIDEYTVLMLHMDGDQSDSQHVVTANGNPQFSTAQSKFGESSMLFDGAGDWLTIPNSTDFNFGAGNFTIDFWMRPADIVSGNLNIFGQWKGSTERAMHLYFIPGVPDKLYFDYSTDGSTIITAFDVANPFIVDTWYHIAIVRNSTDLSLYINGTSVDSYVIGTDSIHNYTRDFYISNQEDGASSYVGYMDEFRISKGIARWTSNFSGSLPSAPYTSDANTKLLLHFDGDVSTTPHTLTVNGDPQLSASTTKFNGAMYFDGVGDYLTGTNSSDFEFGSGDFTIDCWINTTDTDTSLGFIKYGVTGASAIVDTRWCLYISSGSPKIFVGIDGITFYVATATTSVSDGFWHHIAGIRNGSDLYIAVDGIIEHTVDVSTDSIPVVGGDILYLGGWTNEYDGYIDELRVSKGIARWTSNFTPESGPYTE